MESGSYKKNSSPRPVHTLNNILITLSSSAKLALMEPNMEELRSKGIIVAVISKIPGFFRPPVSKGTTIRETSWGPFKKAVTGT